MKISESWLREWVNPALTTQQLAHQMTMAGLEVDAIEPVAGAFDQVVIAKIMQLAPHPQADKLTLCDVSIDSAAPWIRVVCGARNVRVGLCVALALPGAILPGDVKINCSTLRGERSEGMLCSAAELGLEDRSEGILELPEDAPIGQDIRSYLHLNDHIFDIDLTPNRADCFSVQGIAREIAALNQIDWTSPVSLPVSSEGHQTTVTVERLATAACPVYCTRLITGLQPHAITPIWMKERLRRSGLRAIHPVVDVLNYVMLELGQPMHAFDAAAIEGPLRIRYAAAEEAITLLDERTVSLTPDILVIADTVQPLAMAGIMGASQGAVQTETVDVILEAAFFEPLTIAGVARRYGLCTDASQRFERGVDPTLAPLAMERATALLVSIAGGCVGPLQHLRTEVRSPCSIVFRPSAIHRLTGLTIADAEMQDMLKRLGMTVVVVDSTQWHVTVPAYRFDLSLEVDLVEEIVRLYGYENIPAQATDTTLQAGTQSSRETLSLQIATGLSHLGYHEAIHYAFVDPVLQEEMYPTAHVIPLKNPLSSELSQMRAGLWPGLIAAMMHNVHRQQTALRLFERGVVFSREGEQVQERLCVAGLITGTVGELQWNQPTHVFDFYDIKGDVQTVLQRLSGTACTFIAGEHPALHPGKTAFILNAHQQQLGVVGALHPRLQDALDLTQEVFLFELAMDVIEAQAPVRYAPISKYPHVRRDLSLLVPIEVSALAIERVVRAVVDPCYLREVHLFDVYAGSTLGQGQKSVAIACLFQRNDRTLVDADIQIMIEAILSALRTQLSVYLRTE